MRFCEQAVKAGCHLELTNLIVPSLNDSEQQIETLAIWIKEHLGTLMPLHLSAYHPDYQARGESTPVATLIKAQEICRRHLIYVYIGNVISREGQNTLCPGCGNELVRRQGFSVEQIGIHAGTCSRCGRKADFVLV
jgi:pyruvate formate lyase activating enzyme